jgi:sugar phosphate isomerase/epimerase
VFLSAQSIALDLHARCVINLPASMGEKATRRSLLAMAVGGTFVHAQSPRWQFGFSLYGMKTVPVHQAIAHVAKVGYNSTELCLRAGWKTEPKFLTKTIRADIRKQLGDLGLALPSVMEIIGLGRPDGLKTNSERVRVAAEICHETSPGPPALIETTVGGGGPASWEDRKSAMAEELVGLAKVAEEMKTVLAIKAHSKTAMNLPERALWLANQADSKWVSLVYDYSHYLANGLDMRKTMEQIASRAAFVHIKDTAGRAPNHKFLLPGDGDIDYKAYARTLRDAGYRGPVIVEVSIDVFDQPGYDPLGAAQKVWDKVSPAFA